MINDSFEKVYAINLPRRSDRWDSFMKRLPCDWPFKKPERFEAVDGGLATKPPWWNGGPGGWGCYRSHIRIIEDCLNHGIESVLIMEDDAVCVDNFKAKVEEFWKNLPNDWGMVYIGGQHIQEYIRCPRKINDWVYKPFNVNRCHCYGFRGRQMMEMAYLHLHDYFKWKVPHHIDHQLGELHKVLPNGCYAPREWLVAQAEGESDICGQDLQYRMFCSAEETSYPTVDIPCVAILGGYFGGTNTISGVLQHLGLFCGAYCPPLENLHNTCSESNQSGNLSVQNSEKNKGKNDNAVRYFEDGYLVKICQNIYSEPWLYEKADKTDRLNLLRHWAGIQCKRKPEGSKFLCGKHPMLSLLGPDLIQAWNDPHFICVERSLEDSIKSLRQMKWSWHPSVIRHTQSTLQKGREELIKHYAPKNMTISFEHATLLPEKTVDSICQHLNYQPSHEQWQNAVDFMKSCKDDICYAQNDTGIPMKEDRQVK